MQPKALRDFTHGLVIAAGMEAEKADAVATYLPEADLMRQTTHGLALVPWYLQSIRDGVMRRSDNFDTLSDKGAAICWRGKRLPVAWLIAKGLETACERRALGRSPDHAVSFLPVIQPTRGQKRAALRDGRADAPKGTNAAVTITVHDPAEFGGRDAFSCQAGGLADTCLASPALVA